MVSNGDDGNKPHHNHLKVLMFVNHVSRNSLNLKSLIFHLDSSRVDRRGVGARILRKDGDKCPYLRATVGGPACGGRDTLSRSKGIELPRLSIHSIMANFDPRYAALQPATVRYNPLWTRSRAAAPTEGGGTS